VPRSIRFAMLFSLLTLAAARAGHAALLSLTLVSGLFSVDGAAVIPEQLSQESLSGSTIAQLTSPLLYDPATGTPLGLTVRIANISNVEVLFPDVLPGVSVLTGVLGLPGYSTRVNTASGGNADRSGAPGAEGAISRTALDLTLDLLAAGSPVSGSHGGGGGAATGVADNLISITGASGLEIAAYLAGIRLSPGQWVDVPNFAWITAFHRSDDEGRIAFGFDLPTFSFGGVSVTTGAWTGSFAGAAPAEPEDDPSGSTDVPEPGTLPLLAIGCLAGALSRRRRRG